GAGRLVPDTQPAAGAAPRSPPRADSTGSVWWRLGLATDPRHPGARLPRIQSAHVPPRIPALHVRRPWRELGCPVLSGPGGPAAECPYRRSAPPLSHRATPRTRSVRRYRPTRRRDRADTLRPGPRYREGAPRRPVAGAPSVRYGSFWASAPRASARASRASAPASAPASASFHASSGSPVILLNWLPVHRGAVSPWHGSVCQDSAHTTRHALLVKDVEHEIVRNTVLRRPGKYAPPQHPGNALQQSPCLPRAIRTNTRVHRPPMGISIPERTERRLVLTRRFRQP